VSGEAKSPRIICPRCSRQVIVIEGIPLPCWCLRAGVEGCGIATSAPHSPDVAVSQHADAAVGQVLRLAEHLNLDNEALAAKDAARLEADA
jgi:hypothetical protein